MQFDVEVDLLCVQLRQKRGRNLPGLELVPPGGLPTVHLRIAASLALL